MKSIYKITTELATDPKQIVYSGNFRFTVLREGVLRVEYHPTKDFCDYPTQKVTKRESDGSDYNVIKEHDRLEIENSRFHMEVKTSDESLSSLRIEVKGRESFIWNWGDHIETLGGTVRTLDRINGGIPLGDGLMSRMGIGMFDDSDSYLIKEDGFLTRRVKGSLDMYFFVYGDDYKGCLRDFFAISGPTPLLPRFALGNWWSRYHRYDEKEYKELIENFEMHDIPLSVGVVDMDWHITNPAPKYGSGWTGYTWNRKLFPDPEEFMRWIHDKGLKVSLNVHPADGIRAYEDAYPTIAKRMGVDMNKEEPVRFNSADPDFIEAYMECVHHPLEEQGVDFWWIDWQQGTKTALPGLDPLWALNHYHYLDNMRLGNRPMILSRYAKIGSHRYPIGFSGDSIISWKSLRFQPYFTATASNVGYCWWSHDIGGHMKGIYNEELQVRWVQFGVFSPIMRLHCSASPFNHKEPWLYHKDAESIISEYMRLRHQMIPYLYTMNHLLHENGDALIAPMYYDYPNCQESYECPNEYSFGSEMICLPITSSADRRACMASEEFWFPKGQFIDLFTGTIYKGNRKLELYRHMNEMPVMLRAGAIVPLNDDVSSNGTDNPKCLKIIVVAGDDGQFELYEDDGYTMNYQNGSSVITKLKQDYTNGKFVIMPSVGDVALIPDVRSWKLQFMGMACPENIYLIRGVEKKEIEFTFNEYKNVIITESFEVKAEQGATIVFEEGMSNAVNPILHKCFSILDAAQILFREKEKIMDILNADFGAKVRISDHFDSNRSEFNADYKELVIEKVREVCTCKQVFNAIREIITA